MVWPSEEVCGSFRGLGSLRLELAFDRSSIWGGILSRLISVGLSRLKIIAFSCYFVVLVSILVRALAVVAVELALRSCGEWLALVISIMVIFYCY